jgi:pimeloyl-ACP methyl ester carboxylesterase
MQASTGPDVVVDPPFGLPGVRAARIEVNQITLAVLEAGPRDGPLVVLLHGFPELSYTWHAQIEALAAAGCFVVAPDQRGYATSDKPTGIRAYHLDELANDVVGLIDHYGRADAVVVGHDWGAAVAWWVALQHPARVRHLVVMNVPHPAVFLRTLRTSLGQLRRSWYMGFFQLPVLPERAITKGGAGILVRTSNPGSFSREELAIYRHAWRIPGAATGMLNWYRAMRFFPRPPSSQVVPPTLVIWGKRDHALDWRMASASVDCCERGELLVIDDATHWVHRDASDRVNAALCRVIAGASRP